MEREKAKDGDGKYCVLQKSYISLSASVSQIQDENYLPPGVSLVINSTFYESPQLDRRYAPCSALTFLFFFSSLLSHQCFSIRRAICGADRRGRNHSLSPSDSTLREDTGVFHVCSPTLCDGSVQVTCRREEAHNVQTFWPRARIKRIDGGIMNLDDTPAAGGANSQGRLTTSFDSHISLRPANG